MSIPRHISTERTPADRGAGLGRAQSERIARVAEIYGRLFETTAGLGPHDVRLLGGEALAQIAAWAPDLAEEIEGIASGAGIPPELVGALNARTELLALGHGECSVIACLGTATAEGEPIGVQTWDWHEDLADCWMLWEITHPDGRRVETLTEAGVVGKLGVNGFGVSLLLNILGHRDDRRPVGVPIHVLNRRVLDEAESGLQAMQLLSTADVSASSAATVVAADEDGGVVCTVELSPAGPGFVTPDERGVLVHTNHFLTEPGRTGDVMVREAPDTVLRLDHARRGMARLVEGEIDRDLILDVMRSHRGGAGAICCHPAEGAVFGDRWVTLATITVEPATRSMRVLRGGPCQAVADSTTAAPARQSASRHGLAAS
jgi:isopenicillin-N N-acyltransferase like protein